MKNLFQALSMEFNLDDPSFTRVVREQDEAVRLLHLKSSGIAMNLPRSYTEVITGEYGEEWKRACNKEMEMLVWMCVWEEVPIPKNQAVVSTKWVFAYKFNPEGEIT